MDTFGEKLRYERNERGLSIEAVSRILRVDSNSLFALERNDFDALPDEGVIKGWLHAYAECLGVDADMMIEDYLQERDRCLRRLDDATPEPVAEIPPASTTLRAPRSPSFVRLLGSTVLLGAAVFGAWWMFSGDGSSVALQPAAMSGIDTPAAETRFNPAPAKAQSNPAPAKTRSNPVPAKTQSNPVPEKAQSNPSSAETASAVETRPASLGAPVAGARASSLGILDHGVGTGIENRQLVGRSDRFSEGTEVSFWTHVQGGSRGDRIHHVWLQQGVERWRIGLTVGGARWRTYSSKMLHPGSAGDWAVEARDDAGRVLARRDFVCVR
jgi:cytoskeletal protein RodZ